MLKSELKNLKIIKLSLMQNGTLFTKNLTLQSNLVLKQSYLNYPQEIQPLNISLIETFSVLEESPQKILEELLKLPEVLFKPLLTVLMKLIWELVVNLKKFNLELKDIIFSPFVLRVKLQLSSLEEELINLFMKPKDLLMMPL